MIHRRGFTLIELIAASTVAAILVCAVFGVLAGITRDRQKLIINHVSDKPDADLIVELLRRDLASTTSFNENDGTIVLHTFNHLDTESMEFTDRPSLVTWRTDNESGVQCVLRAQETIDDPVPPAPFIALAACHVRRMEINALKPNDDRQISMDDTPATQGKSRDDQVPARIHLKIEFDESSAGIDRVICLR